MPNDHATFCGTYSDWKLIRTRSVVQIIFEVPLEASGDAYRVLGGMPQPSKEVWCAIARLNNGKEAIPSEPRLAPKPAPSADNAAARAPRETLLARRAAILCNDPVFQTYLFEHDMIAEKSKDLAATAVRLICNVGSRAEITPGTPAGDAWNDLYSKFMGWKLAA